MMNWKMLAGLTVLVVLTTGCVERKLMIRSEPSGVPAYVDEEPVGETPVEVPFAHYGRRLVRVGPVVDEYGSVQYRQIERMTETAPPWYELFPIDFFSEVLWPGTLVDKHEVTIHLPRSEEYTARGAEAAAEVREEAEEYRRESLSVVPAE